jgi:hypothetical protein
MSAEGERICEGHCFLQGKIVIMKGITAQGMIIVVEGGKRKGGKI